MFSRFRNVIERRGSVWADHSAIGARSSSSSRPRSTNSPIIVEVNDLETENEGRIESAVTPGAYRS